ncbi:MAG TPA: CsbD family protein [Caulobacteraceae bacterium]|jgi:uncharacterized protein YjbJ (UPF0337 family)
MNANRWRGTGRKFTGRLKEAAGRISGSRRLQIEGVLDRIIGGLQDTLGRLQDRFSGEVTDRPARPAQTASSPRARSASKAL